jgi:hypothetical protein
MFANMLVTSLKSDLRQLYIEEVHQNETGRADRTD